MRLPPKNLREALIKIERLANRTMSPVARLRISSEFPDTAHPLHRRVIEHQGKILDYLTDLLKPFAIDRRVAARILGVIDGALSMRLVFVPEAGRAFGYDQPEIYSAAIRAFLQDQPLPLAPYRNSSAPPRVTLRVGKTNDTNPFAI